eukprot:CAMPEP_0201488322 /NCGR_PEP_ID=MMETSP0151_2-20130828/17888_1 /ASSEMBLY_ACC=CAM_ASM_000257 /TAXON_ID=200890 /ORGANISM="Paramoeba atlantica, Strain 621/1 / CCAP 1560/9" /LENGTH=102 /DNA_ID=CAMNT_0047873585 /DNA_START=43 /DNA_END=351 /DNA_ORIENTATION=+
MPPFHRYAGSSLSKKLPRPSVSLKKHKLSRRKKFGLRPSTPVLNSFLRYDREFGIDTYGSYLQPSSSSSSSLSLDPSLKELMIEFQIDPFGSHVSEPPHASK